MILLLLILGGSYLYWKFNSISNKKLFFKSPLVISLLGSLAMLSLSFMIVNAITTNTTSFFPTPKTYYDSIRDDIKTDTTMDKVLHESSNKKHYYYIDALIKEHDYIHLSKLEHHYKKIIKAKDSALSLGYFGLGVIELKQNHYQEALNDFKPILNIDMPCLNYCLGEIYTSLHDTLTAEDHYLKELDLTEGFSEEALGRLIRQYTEIENYSKLKSLFDHPNSIKFFPPEIARLTFLHAHDPANYLVWAFKSVEQRTQPLGFLAGLAIAVIWLIYLSRLNIFAQQKIPFLTGLMFIAGMSSVILILVINDLSEMYMTWDLNGEFFSDLFYTVIMIGIPEEFSKIAPLLILVSFIRLKEPIDYILYASASALGFAFVENLLYFQDVSNGIIHGRAYLAVLGHMIDSSIVAYGLVLARFKKKKPFYLFPLTFAIGSIIHGLYDFLLFHGFIILFFIFFIFIVQLWIIIINNCLNNSPLFSYKTIFQAKDSRLLLALSLTGIFSIEYILVGFSWGAQEANLELASNIYFAGFFIGFFTSNLSSFNLVKGYWRDIYFSSREKRGYGTLPKHSALISWYFVNSIRAHNYVGLRVSVTNDPGNRNLSGILTGVLTATIVNRVILYEDDDADPNWFIAKTDSPLPIEGVHPHYVLIKLRYQNESLLYEEDLQVFFKGIPDANLLRTAKPLKKDFPFYGWTIINLIRDEAAFMRSGN